MVPLMASRRSVAATERVAAFRCVVCGLPTADDSTLCVSHNHQYERLVGSGRHSEAMRLLMPGKEKRSATNR